MLFSRYHIEEHPEYNPLELLLLASDKVFIDVSDIEIEDIDKV